MDGETCLLLVESHEDTRRLVARLLRERGFDVVVAADMKVALAVAARRRIDAGVIDTAMAEGELTGFLRRVRSLCDRAPMVATTTAIGERLARVKGMGFCRVLMKPYGLGELITAVGAAVGERSVCRCA